MRSRLRQWIRHRPLSAGVVVAVIIQISIAVFVTWFGISQITSSQSLDDWQNALVPAPYVRTIVVNIIVWPTALVLFIAAFLRFPPPPQPPPTPPSSPIWVKNRQILASHPKEFLPMIQKRYLSKASGVMLGTSSQGRSGALVLFVTQIDEKDNPRRIPDILKLGQRDSILGEAEKYHKYVENLLRHASNLAQSNDEALDTYGDYASIAYDLAGRNEPGDLLSLSAFYKDNAVERVCKVIATIFNDLIKGWYSNGELALTIAGNESDEDRRCPGFYKGKLYHQYFVMPKKIEDGTADGIVSVWDDTESVREEYRKTVYAALKKPRLFEQELLKRPTFLNAQLIDRWLNPLHFLLNWDTRMQDRFKFHHARVHGDLLAQNIVIDRGEDPPTPWLIDFSHSGNGLNSKHTKVAMDAKLDVGEDWGHTLRDFARLEASIKFLLTPITEAKFERAIKLEQALLDNFLLPNSPDWCDNEPAFKKAWECIFCLRQFAKGYLQPLDDVQPLTGERLQPYYLALFASTLEIVGYQPQQFPDEGDQLQHKRFALASAGMLCARLDPLAAAAAAAAQAAQQS